VIPISDRLPTRRFPIMTILLIVANVVIFGFELLLEMLGLLEPFIYAFGVVPYRVLHQFDALTAFSFFSSMFLHGGFLHLAGNMLYLWIFGNNVEDALGHFRFLIFYFLCGVLASLAQVLASVNSTIPGIGASGAIAGVLGAYLVLFPRARIITLIPLGIFTQLAELPAVIVLGFWFILQLFNGVLALGLPSAGGVAWFAHIGGFVAGWLLVRLFAIGRRQAIRYYHY
jgi:membrane associated rhomboid family serine protease